MVRKLSIILGALILTVLAAGCASAQEATAQGQAPSPGTGAQASNPDASASASNAGSAAPASNPNSAAPASSTSAVAEGYTLFSPLASTTTYLIDNEGRLVHTWESAYTPGNSVYLLDNGDLLRTGSIRSQVFNAGGIGGIVEEYTWDGDLVWSYTYASDTVQQHHDIERLPNGDVLMIAWEYKTEQEALAAGRDPNLIPTGAQQGPGGQQPGGGSTTDHGLWADHIIEVDPSTNAIVWEWHVWDHLVQDYDPSAPNYGDPAANPARIDLNYVSGMVSNDWNHINSIAYNPALDQIMVSVHSFNEIWIIDHSTTTAEAAGPAGDLLYRWGNPAAYGASGTQELYGQHDATWIDAGLPGAGDILIFNNGSQRDRPYSSVEEIAPPLNADETYSMAGNAFQSPGRIWTYTADFFAQNISSAQRLANGDTLICDGPDGTFYEVTSGGEIVWQYAVPATGQRQNQASNQVFRAEKYAPDFAGFSGHDLTPGDLLGGAAATFSGSGTSSQGQLSQPGQQGPSGQPSGQPSGSGPTGQNGPPQAAIAACSGLTAGTTCTVTTPQGQSVAGTCQGAPSGQVACLPAGGQRGPGG